MQRFLSKNQIQKLELHGIRTLWDLVTYFPYDLQSILPFDQYIGETKAKYLLQGELLDFQYRQNNRPYYLLTFRDSNNRIVSAFLFATSPYIIKTLEIGQTYQALLKRSGDFWQCEKFAALADELIPEFKLGQAIIQPYILSKYPKLGILQSPFLVQVHSQLPASVYNMDLSGLVPPNDLIPANMSLMAIHKPDSTQDFEQALTTYRLLKIFLKLTLVEYLESEKEVKNAKNATLDVDFLKQFSIELPFSLSTSQKQTIWDILGEITG